MGMYMWLADRDENLAAKVNMGMHMLRMHMQLQLHVHAAHALSRCTHARLRA